MANSIRCGECGECLDGLPDQPTTGRQPCPKCGSTARTFGRSSRGRKRVAISHLALLSSRNDTVVGFREESRGMDE